jgi:uncharacterized protein YfiM (DUF2279 family)
VRRGSRFFLICAAIAGAAFSAQASEREREEVKAQDSWTGSDKAVHFGVSFVLGFAAGNQWPENKPLAISVAMIPGVLKEISDRSTTGFSGKDIAVDLLGATMGVYSSHWLIARENRKVTLFYRKEF